MDDMKILGEVEIPHHRFSKENTANQAREIIAKLRTDKALLVEFGSKTEANTMRSMMYTMAILKFGEAGHLATSNQDNLLYAWLLSLPDERSTDKK